jgi:hypothetical protein
MRGLPSFGRSVQAVGLAGLLGIALAVPAFAADRDNPSDLNQVSGVVSNVSGSRIEINRYNHHKYMATRPEGLDVHVGDYISVKGENEGGYIRTSHWTLISNGVATSH